MLHPRSEVRAVRRMARRAEEPGGEAWGGRRGPWHARQHWMLLRRTLDVNPPAKLFRNFLKTEIENQKRGSCDFER